MATATAENSSLIANQDLFRAITAGVESCLTMCDSSVKCVGMSTIPTRDAGIVTGMIGVHGQVSGFITVNMAEHVARKAIAGLLQDEFDKLTPQVIDGVGEMTNIIAGGVKSVLAKTPWSFSHVTVPSVIIGQNYQIAYATGLEYLSVTFEQKNEETLLLDDRLMKVAISLIRL